MDEASFNEMLSKVMEANGTTAQDVYNATGYKVTGTTTANGNTPSTATVNGKTYQTSDRTDRTVEEDMSGHGDYLTTARNIIGAESEEARYDDGEDIWSNAAVMAILLEAGYSINDALAAIRDDNDEALKTKIDDANEIIRKNRFDKSVSDATAAAKQKTSGSNALANTVASQNERAKKDNDKLAIHYSGSNNSTSNSESSNVADNSENSKTADNSNNASNTSNIPKFNPSNIGFNPKASQSNSSNNNQASNNPFSGLIRNNEEVERASKVAEGVSDVSRNAFNKVVGAYNYVKDMESTPQNYNYSQYQYPGQKQNSNSKNDNQTKNVPKFNPTSNTGFKF